MSVLQIFQRFSNQHERNPGKHGEQPLQQQQPIWQSTPRHDACTPTAAAFFSSVISDARHSPSRQNMTCSPARCPAR
jgi:hypothetical protein